MYDPGDVDCVELKNLRCSLLLRVEEIQIKNTRGESNELEAIRYVWKNDEMLEKFSFDISTSKQNLQEEILMFPRDFKTCKSEFFVLLREILENHLI